MSAPDFVDKVIPSLPTITGNGLFPVNIVVPNSASSFTTDPSGNQSNSYSYPLIEPAKLIGTGSQPYMPVALPAYISTLYNNVYNINNNLQNTIATAASDDRFYPTSYAVQQYVQSQIAGSQVITGIGPAYPIGNTNTYFVTTTLSNTLITNTNPASGFSYTYNGNITSISLFWMDESADAPRNGTNKSVMFADSGYLTDASGVPTGQLAFLCAGDSSFFINMGVQYKYYQFVFTGDFVTFVQAYNGSGWDWLVTGSMGVFSNNVVLSNGNISSNGSVKNPAGTSFGGL
jgi:hypothetical protein